MALSCFLSRLSSTQPLLKASTFQTIRSSFSRSATILGSNHLHSQDKSQNLLNKNVVAIQPGKLTTLAKPFSSTPVRLSDHQGHSHVNIWRLERLLSAVLVPLVPAALIFPSQILDTLCAVIIVMHTHWGLEAIIVDYIRPILFGDLAPKIGLGALYLFSIVVLAGLLNLIYNDSGLANAFRQIWKL